MQIIVLVRSWYHATRGQCSGEHQSKCPPGEPPVGYNSTCQKLPLGWESPSEKAKREEKDGPKCDFKLRPYDFSYNTYLEANPSMKEWAELNPEMASKERLRLQSVD